MAWQEEMTIIFRNMIADWGVGSPPVYNYSDSRLQQLLVVAAQLIQSEVSFTTSYAIDVVSLAISPDPTTPARDDSFINLSILKAACIIDNSEARAAALGAAMISDMGVTYDPRGVSQARLEIWKRGWCQNYNDARFEFIAGNVGSAGAAIISPFRLYYGGNGPPYEGLFSDTFYGRYR